MATYTRFILFYDACMHEEETKQKEQLESFLAKHEKLYERYLKEVENIPKMVVIFASWAFSGYQKKVANRITQLPIEQQVDQFKGSRKELKKAVSTRLKMFGNKSMLYFCVKCGQMFDKRRGLAGVENHVKVDEKFPNSKKLIGRIDKQYYLDLLKLL